MSVPSAPKEEGNRRQSLKKSLGDAPPPPEVPDPPKSRRESTVQEIIDDQEAAKLPDPVDSISDRLEDIVEPVAGHDDNVPIRAASIDLGECPCGPNCNCDPPLSYLDGEDEEEEGEGEGEGEGEMERGRSMEAPSETIPNYNLNDFVRAKEFFMSASTKTGISLYDHFSELIRKLLDNRAPDNPVDFVEELSLNLKRYRFGMAKDVIQDSYYLSDPMVKDFSNKIKTWKKHAMWSAEQQERGGEDESFGGFPNLLRLQYYLEQINIGLPREEMFKVALQMRQIKMQNPVTRVRFWGKIFGTQGNYYIFEAEIPEGQILSNVWAVPVDEKAAKDYNNMMDLYEEEASISVPGAADTFNRAGGAVLDPEIISAYQTKGKPGSQLTAPGAKLSGGPLTPPPVPLSCNTGEYLGEQSFSEEESKEAAKWKEYQNELTVDFPQATVEVVPEAPAESFGQGVNRRVFFVWPERLGRAVALKKFNDLDWSPESLIDPTRIKGDSGEEQGVLAVSSDTTPKQINSSRQIRWFLTGDLDAEVRSYPPFPGREGHYLRALLSRITAGTAVSPKGYYKTKKPADDDDEEEEEDEEDVEEEEDEEQKEDVVYPVKKFRPENIKDLVNPQLDLWVHHAAHILGQGRTVWFDVEKLKEKKKGDEEAEEDEDDEDVEEEEEEEGVSKNKEVGPKLFSSLEQDTVIDNSRPWSARASSSVFTEFEVANVRSNLWPGANALCTVKGKVENIYLGDGLKFNGHSYAPPLPEEPQLEYKVGPELMEIDDPTVQEEQEWLAKLQLEEIGDVEAKFVDNEDEGEDEDEDDDD